MAEKKKGFDLAAALGAVSNLDTGAVEGREQLEYIDIDRIHPDERNFYELAGINDLAANIELAGLQQPLRVRPGGGGDYVIVSGHRRHAAVTQLVKEGQEKFRQVPCLVDRSSGQTTEVEAMLQELRLIYGNSDTRQMSSSERSKQAERVEMLLYKLKEAGVEFPGRMRDHVAQACKVSASKLARLKVIRENLIDELKKDWEGGKLNESVAYAFAQHPPQVQQLTIQQMTNYGTVNLNRKYWMEGPVKYDAKKVAKELKSRKGPKGTCEGCDAKDRRLKRMALNQQWNDHCSDGKCCHDCPNIGTCDYACPHLSGEVAKARNLAKAKRATDLEAKKKQDAAQVAPTVRLWKRFGEARAASGLTFEEYARKADVIAFRRQKKVEDFEQGLKITPSSGGLPYTGGDGLDEWRIRPLIKAADALGVSIDYLLCRTDEPGGIITPVPAVASNAGQPPLQFVTAPEQPPKDGPYYCKLSVDGLDLRRVLYWSSQFKAWSFNPHGPSIDAVCLGWYPLPEDE